MRMGLKHQWLILAGLALGVTVTNGFARFSYGLILPAMKSEMGWNYAQAGWLNTSNALGYNLTCHYLTKFNGLRIRFCIVHAPTHVGVK